jgi:hypothetical protein
MFVWFPKLFFATDFSNFKVLNFANHFNALLFFETLTDKHFKFL